MEHSNNKKTRPKFLLHEAVEKSSITALTTALDEGSLDINALDKCGQTALHCAVRRDLTQGVIVLLKHGASVDARDSNGRTPLHIAAKYGRSKQVELLLNRRAKITSRDNNGQTPLHLGALQEESKVEVLTLLIMRGADINARDHLGRTPLHLAVTNKRRWWYLPTGILFRELLDWGASIDAMDANGETAIEASVCTFTAKIELKKHLMKLKYAHLPCNNTNATTFDLDEFDNFQISCLKELQIMKTIKLGTNVLYDVFSKYNDPTFIPNITLNSAIWAESLKFQFPIYATLLRATYHRSKIRVGLLDRAQGIFTAFLPPEISRNILSFVVDDDLENVIKSVDGITSKSEVKLESNILSNIFDEVF